MLDRLIYLSFANAVFDTGELRALIDAAARSNAAAGITGALAHEQGYFLQLIEGPHEALDALWTRIGADTRHRIVRVIDRHETDERLFPNWGMRYARGMSGRRLFPLDPEQLRSPVVALGILQAADPKPAKD